VVEGSGGDIAYREMRSAGLQLEIGDIGALLGEIRAAVDDETARVRAWHELMERVVALDKVIRHPI
jgi:hypothetical protein